MELSANRCEVFVGDGSCDLLAKLVSVFIKEMRFLSSVDYHYKLYALFVG